MEKVLVGMSGGVDSTYAALRLREMGYDVYGAVMRMHDYTEIKEAEESATAIGIPLTVVDCAKLFSSCVISDFTEAYLCGRTPNPCIVCNEKVKLRALYDEATRQGIPYIATGHYAKIVFENGRFSVARAADHAKDQSYMLYRLPQDILSALLLPLGEIKKSETLAEARRLCLRAAERKESQEICFVKDESYAAYIERMYGKCEEGDFVDEEGRVLGRHKGIVHYTVGQRKGLGVSSTGRLFVKEIDVASNRIVLSSSKVVNKEFRVSSLVFSGIEEEKVSENLDGLTVKLRYTARPVSTRVVKEGKCLHACLEEEAPFVTPGQSAVFYLGEKVAFGGIVI